MISEEKRNDSPHTSESDSDLSDVHEQASPASQVSERKQSDDSSDDEVPLRETTVHVKPVNQKKNVVTRKIEKMTDGINAFRGRVEAHNEKMYKKWPYKISKRDALIAGGIAGIGAGIALAGVVAVAAVAR